MEKQEQNEPERKAVYQIALLWLAQPAVLLLLKIYTTQSHLARGGSICSGLGTPTETINQEKSPTDLPTAPSDGGTPSSESPASRYVQVCVKFTETKQHSSPDQARLFWQSL